MHNIHAINLSHQMPCIFFTKDKSLCFSSFNKMAQTVFDVENENDIIGKSDFQLPWKDRANIFSIQDEKVLKGEPQVNFDITNTFLNDKIAVIVQKTPIYSDKGKIIGISGFGFHIKQENYANFVSTFKMFPFKKQDNQLKNHESDFCYKNVQFTHRQAQVIAYILRGHTANSISQHLNLSKRTVETHIENIKNLIGTNNKIELIDKAFEFGFIDLLFYN